MSVKIGNLTFDRVHYDTEGDVLYLHRAEPKEAVDFDASPEGHALRYNAAGELIGVTIINARWLLEHEGEVTITIPEQIRVPPAALEKALVAA
jgi:YD repeat-containing protein